ncbi:MAG: AmmeMemoRadiSam system radical SAM enzyme [Oscillospiraceae bacterium]|nr:AmmeMemoRadiSam system radical SAM enzyme [Oscillospiraceae bacterium]
MNKRALYWKALEGGRAACLLCGHHCVIEDGAAGRCGVRANIRGALYASGYGKVSSLALDPIEKKPLLRFKRGSKILSVGGFGCNLRCGFCQNSSISLEYSGALEGAGRMSPEELVILAEGCVAQGNIGVAFTYNEPFTGYEFALEGAKAVKAAGLCCVLVTNGYVNPEPLLEILPYIDAMNIDLKAFSEEFYRRVGGGLAAVKDTIATASKRCHVEITTLVIPGENERDAGPIAEFIASVDENIPLHLTRFYPRYKYLDRPETPLEVLLALKKTAQKHLKYVF